MQLTWIRSSYANSQHWFKSRYGALMGDARNPYLETPEVIRVCGLPYSTLDYWVRTGLVSPSVRASSGRRRARQWSVLDVICVRALKELRDSGAPVRVMREAREALRQEWTTSLRDRMLYWDGGDIVRVDEWSNLVSVVNNPGQGVFRIVAVPLDALREEAEAVAKVDDRMQYPDDRRSNAERSRRTA